MVIFINKLSRRSHDNSTNWARVVGDLGRDVQLFRGASKRMRGAPVRAYDRIACLGSLPIGRCVHNQQHHQLLKYLHGTSSTSASGTYLLFGSRHLTEYKATQQRHKSFDSTIVGKTSRYVLGIHRSTHFNLPPSMVSKHMCQTPCNVYTHQQTQQINPLILSRCAVVSITSLETSQNTHVPYDGKN